MAVRKGSALSLRELELLRLMASGETRISAAEKLYISSHTARTMSSRILRKLGARNMAHAVYLSVISEILTENDVPAGEVPVKELKETEKKRKIQSSVKEYADRPSGPLVTSLTSKQRKSTSAFIELDKIFRAELTRYSLEVSEADSNGWEHKELIGSLTRVHQDIRRYLGRTVLTGVSLPEDRPCAYGQQVYVWLEGSSADVRDGGYRLRIRWPHHYDASMDQRSTPRLRGAHGG